MLLKPLLVPASVLAASLLLLSADDARACSIGGCLPGVFLPAGNDVPASLPGFFWLPQTQPGAPIDPSQIQLVQVTAAGETPVPATATPVMDSKLYVIKLEAPLVPDADYVMRAGQFCIGEGAPQWPTQAAVHTTSAVALPTTLGKIFVYGVPQGPLSIATMSGACNAIVTAASKRIEVGLSAEAAPWKNVLAYETLVDGEKWSGSKSAFSLFTIGQSWQGRAKDLVYTVCDNSGDDFAIDGLAPGTHSVKIRATIPGSDVAVETETVSFELACAPPDPDPTIIMDNESDESTCSVSAPGSSAQASSAAGALALALGVAGARKRRAQRRA
jgi:hypothetical protein